MLDVVLARGQSIITYTQDRAGVVLVILQGYAAISGSMALIDRLHTGVGVGVLATESVSCAITALGENTPDEAGALTSSVFRHVRVAGNRASRAGTLAVEEDHEDQATKQGQSSQNTDDNAGNRAAAEARFLVASLCVGSIRAGGGA